MIAFRFVNSARNSYFLNRRNIEFPICSSTCCPGIDHGISRGSIGNNIAFKQDGINSPWVSFLKFTLEVLDWFVLPESPDGSFSRLLKSEVERTFPGKHARVGLVLYIEYGFCIIIITRL